MFLVIYIFSAKISSLILNLFKIKLKKKILQKQNKYLISLQNQIKFLLIIFSLLSLFLIIFLQDFLFIYYFIIFNIGILAGTFLILCPKIFANINRYRLYLDIGNWANHFNAIKSKNLDKKLDKDMRGGNYKWLIFLKILCQYTLFLYSILILKFFYMTPFLTLNISLTYF